MLGHSLTFGTNPRAVLGCRSVGRSTTSSARRRLTFARFRLATLVDAVLSVLNLITLIVARKIQNAPRTRHATTAGSARNSPAHQPVCLVSASCSAFRTGMSVSRCIYHAHLVRSIVVTTTIVGMIASASTTFASSLTARQVSTRGAIRPTLRRSRRTGGASTISSQTARPATTAMLARQIPATADSAVVWVWRRTARRRRASK